ncbi:hypothetical protein OROHE_015077 [Orobanche hederae]
MSSSPSSSPSPKQSPAHSLAPSDRRRCLEDRPVASKGIPTSSLIGTGAPINRTATIASKSSSPVKSARTLVPGPSSDSATLAADNARILYLEKTSAEQSILGPRPSNGVDQLGQPTASKAQPELNQPTQFPNPTLTDISQPKHFQSTKGVFGNQLLAVLLGLFDRLFVLAVYGGCLTCSC